MTKQIRYLSVAILAFASVGLAQTTMSLTGVGDGAVAYPAGYPGGVYVSPYQGTVSQSGIQTYSGYIICDDFNTESYLGSSWTVTATNAGDIAGSGVKFQMSTYSDPFLKSDTVTDQQAYDAVAWLANQLVSPSNVTNKTAQTNISFAIWDIFDGQAMDPLNQGTVATLISEAFAAAQGGYVGSDVTVYTPSSPSLPTAAQEFLVVNMAEPSFVALLGLDLLAVVGLILFLQRRLAARRA